MRYSASAIPDYALPAPNATDQSQTIPEQCGTPFHFATTSQYLTPPEHYRRLGHITQTIRNYTLAHCATTEVYYAIPLRDRAALYQDASQLSFALPTLSFRPDIYVYPVSIQPYAILVWISIIKIGINNFRRSTSNKDVSSLAP